MDIVRGCSKPVTRRVKIKTQLLLAIAVLPVFVGSGICSPPPPEPDFRAASTAATKVLQGWYNTDGLWDTAFWWNAAISVEAVESVVRLSNGGAYTNVIRTTFERNGGTNFLNEFYDDEGWWALAWIEAFDLTGEPRYLAAAQTIFADMQQGWDNHCDGGIWWSKKRQYKNAIANELFFLVAIRLHQRTPGDDGPGSCIDWARREWAWFQHTGLINHQHLVNDGLDEYCDNNDRSTWTYNQGVIIGALVELYKSTGDTNALKQATLIADAATDRLTDGKNVLREPREWHGLSGNDTPQFKGIFVRHLAELYDATLNSAYCEFLVTNARAILTNDRNSLGQFGGRWAGPFDSVDAIRQTSALRLLTSLARPATDELPLIVSAADSMFSHAVGTNSGSAAWRCGPADLPGIALLTPNLITPPPGSHVIHVRMAVDALSKSGAILARVEVGTVNHNLRWKDFHALDQSFDFPVKIRRANSPVPFRILWEQPKDGPELTVEDISVDGAVNYAAINLEHEIGRRDPYGNWSTDITPDKRPGILAKGLGPDSLRAGNYDVSFELSVDNFNLDQAQVASLSVFDPKNNEIFGGIILHRNDFHNVLYHTFTLPIHIATNQQIGFRVYFESSPHAPRLTVRGILLRRPKQ
jgi:predicted alpha-1,6-mannanase (GH76 family)